MYMHIDAAETAFLIFYEINVNLFSARTSTVDYLTSNTNRSNPSIRKLISIVTSATQLLTYSDNSIEHSSKPTPSCVWMCL